MNGLNTFLTELAKTQGSKAIIEIPTFWLIPPDANSDFAYGKTGATTFGLAMDKEAWVQAFVEKVLAFAATHEVEIAGFEIGNEYRGYLSPVGYARVVAALAPAIERGIAGAATDIIVQIDDASNNRVPLGPETTTLEGRNNQVLEFLNRTEHQTAREAIDAVTFHYYYDEGEQPGTNTTWRESYDTIGDWVAAFAEIAGDWGPLVEVLATEWGVVKNLPTDPTMTQAEIDVSNFGLMALAPTLEIFSQMVLNGVDGLTIWPLLLHPNALYAQREGAPLSPLGALFDVMDDRLLGKQAMAIEVPEGAGFDVHAFVGPDQGGIEDTAFVSSLQAGSQTLQIDLAHLRAIPGAVSVQVIRATGADGTFSFGGSTWNGFTDWSDPDAHGQLAAMPHSVSDGILSLTLGSYEVAVLHYAAFDRVITSSQHFALESATDDQVIGRDVADWISTGAGRDSVSAGDGNDMVRTGAGDDTLQGEAGNDSLYGGEGPENAGDDVIFGGADEDQLFGGFGDDTLEGGSHADSLVGWDGADVLNGGSSSDTILGGNGDDVIDGGSSADTLQGDAGMDSILGDSNADLIFGGTEDDTIRGGTSNDTVWGGSHEDRVWGEDGNDSLMGDGSSDTIYGGDGNDLVDGGGSADVLYGGSGTDTVNGGTNNDTLYGGASSDTVTGGTGRDVFVFSTGIGSSVDTISDFSVADDIIWLEVEDFAGLSLGALAAAAFTADSSGLATTAAHRLIYDSDTGALFFDADGNAAGARVQFATLATGLALSEADFFVI